MDPRRARARIAAVATVTVAIAAATFATAGGAQHGHGSTAALARPNIVVVMTDDQELEWKNGARVWVRPKVMPNTYDLFTKGGTVFQNFVVTSPVCCPSRASYLTGQYGHNNGVLANKPGYASLVDPSNMLPLWLRQSGYLTAQVGRWLHGYETVTPDNGAAPAPGWSEWIDLLNYDRYYGYDLSVNGQVFRYGNGNHDYVTDVLNRRALHFVRTNVDGERPLFLNLAHVAPHSAKALPNQCTRSAIPARRDYGRFQHTPLPVPPSYSEPDISDKPQYLQDRPQIDPLVSGELRRRYRCRLASLYDVDRGVGQLVDAFKAAHELGNTVFIFLSDNGYFSGEHRLRSGKGLPYEEAIHVPLAIRVPPKYLGVQAAVPSTTQLGASIDLAPTILQLAGAQPCTRAGTCRALDGRSLLPLMQGSTDWPADRGVMIEQQNEIAGLARRRDFGPCTFVALRTSVQILNENLSMLDSSTGQCVAQSPPVIEHYNLLADPFELQNLYSAASGPNEEQVGLLNRFQALRYCAGTATAPVAGRTPCE